MSYLQDFLFTPDRVRQPVKALSGGESNRLLLAKLFTQPANVLVLDEPTNDLDVETLELLEELLLDFDGTLLLVSHDRAFMDNVVTSVLAFEGEGRVREYVGGYTDWVRQGGKLPPAPWEGRPARASSRRPRRTRLSRPPRQRARRPRLRRRPSGSSSPTSCSASSTACPPRSSASRPRWRPSRSRWARPPSISRRRTPSPPPCRR